MHRDRLNLPAHRVIGRLLLVVGILSAAPLKAEDIDVYLSGSGLVADEKPSILIILDNSGSMDTVIPGSSEAFNTSTTYSGSYNNARTYWTTGSSCSSIGSTSNQWFTATNNRCNASLTPLANQGFYQGDRIARWNGSTQWRNLTGGNNPTYVDCQKDYTNSDPGTGGLGYPTNTTSSITGPYTTTKSLANIVSSGTTPNGGAKWGSFNRPLLCSGNYMNYLSTPASQSKTRMQVAKQVTKDIIDTTANVRFGLMIFNRNTPTGSYNGGRIVYGINDMTDVNKLALKTIIGDTTVTVSGGDTVYTYTGIEPTTWTPLSETMWEAYRYFAGLSVDYGDDDSTQTPAADTTVISSGSYVSPFEFACQQAYIVYITDGEPTKDTSATDNIQTLIGKTCDNTGGLSTDAERGGQCLDDLAEYMYKNDVLATRNGTQKVITYTIRIKGANESDSGLLTETANNGGGKAYTATTSQEITSSFQAAVSEILATTTSFAAPSLSVNAFNRLETNQQVYFALFKTSETTKWAGNVKKFNLNPVTKIITGQSGVAAIDPTTHKIVPGVCSVWSDCSGGNDGNDVIKGGAGSKVPARADRLILTYTGSETNPTSPVALNVDAHKFVTGNEAITLDMLGITTTGDDTQDAQNRADRINWIRGQDLADEDDDNVTNEDRWKMGDPLHSRPLVVSYNSSIKKVFVGGNDGMLRMIDETTGVENWAFLPKEVFSPLQATLFANLSGQSPPHPQGLDGSPVAWVYDKDGDGIIEADDGDFVRIAVGQRRGGKNYYMLDVTPDTDGNVFPKFMWQLTGAAGNFLHLGQSWSQPVFARIQFGTSATDSTAKTVMIFAGGYDDQDKVWGKSDTTGTTVGAGNAIYMVDPATGGRLWWASRTGSGANLELARMEYAIPSEVAAYDTNGDNLTDRLYVGDLGGQLWRIDLSPTLRLNTNAGSTGAVLFDANAPVAANRKFFYPPAIAPVTDPVYSLDTRYDLVTIGSGNREDPVNTAVHDQFFAIRDTVAGYIPANDADHVPLNISQLLDITSNIDPTTNQLKGSAETHNMGWYLKLQESGGSWVGEKALAGSIILDGVVYFTTFVPSDPNANTGCTPQEGTAYAYAIEALTGEPSFDRNGNGAEEAGDRRSAIGGGIPTEVVPVYHNSGVTGIIGVGGGAAATELSKPVQARTYWYQKTQ